MVGYQRERVLAAAEAILGQRAWCVFEVCLDVPLQLWEARVVIFHLAAEAVADAVESEIDLEPTRDGRLTGCDRRTLAPLGTLGGQLCYVAERQQNRRGTAGGASWEVAWSRTARPA